MPFRRLLGLAIALIVSTLLFAVDASATRVEIIISKVSQKMTVVVDGSTEYVWPVSTGAAKYETPTGSFRPFRMEAEHFSKEWDDAPMPHSIFFTGEGHAIHGSYHVKSLGRKASHGCVRISPENAEILFGIVESAGMSNTRIVLKGGLFDFGGGGRSFADVGTDIEKVVNKKPYRGFFWSLNQPKKKVAIKAVKNSKTVAVKKVDTKSKKVVDTTAKKPDVKPRKVADKCVAKDGKACAKAPAVKAASNG
jgi:L,D-transpeptidase catalytic domain